MLNHTYIHKRELSLKHLFGGIKRAVFELAQRGLSASVLNSFSSSLSKTKLIWFCWLLLLLHLSFSPQLMLVDLHCSLSDSKSLRVSRTLLSILADLNNSWVRMVSTLSPISISSSLFSKPSGIGPSAPTIICITIPLMFSGKVLVFVYLFTYQPERQNPQYVNLFFLLTLGQVVWPELGDSFVSQNPWNFIVTFSRIDSGLCIYHLVEWSN